MGKRGRRNAKRLRAIAEISKMRRSSARALGRMKKKKGDDTEKICDAISASLLRKGLIAGTKRAERWSYMDVVLKTDRVIWRLRDGAPVPVQLKSSFVGPEEKEKFRFFERKYRKPPVFVVITPQDTDLTKIEDSILRKIDSWGGNFWCEDWQFKYSKFFDFIGHPGFGVLQKRIKIFFSEKRRAEKALDEKKNEPNDIKE